MLDPRSRNGSSASARAANRSHATDREDRSAALRQSIEASGYHPTVVIEGMWSALGGEPVNGYVVHHEPTFDRDEIRRHATVVALTPTRLVVGHTDEHPADDVVDRPYISTMTEAIALSTVQSVVVNRVVTEPDPVLAGTTVRSDGGSDAAADGVLATPPAGQVAEAVVTIGWGAVGRIDLEPATCGDPDCEGDHGYTGSVTTDDFSLRVSATADGPEAVDTLLDFARELSAATVGH